MSALIMIYDLSCQLIQAGGNNLNNKSRMLVWSDDKCYSIYVPNLSNISCLSFKYILYYVKLYTKSPLIADY